MKAPSRETLTLKAGKTRLLAISAGNLVFGALGFWLYQRDQSTTGLGLGVLCSVLALGTAAQLLPGASELTLDQEGFTVKAMFRTQRYRWMDITGFSVGKIGLNSMVVFNFTDDFRSRSEAERAASDFMKNLNGFEASIPGGFGKSPQELSQLMNSWKSNQI